ncbi:MAG: hypothetical protein M0Z49_00750 [Chloroflexi bacterium]|nr:hypothetical protein [Chloroflexota bacterium]
MESQIAGGIDVLDAGFGARQEIERRQRVGNRRPDAIESLLVRKTAGCAQVRAQLGEGAATRCACGAAGG